MTDSDETCIVLDRFEVDKVFEAHLAFPCCVCVHRFLSDQDFPCIRCENNLHAKLEAA